MAINIVLFQEQDKGKTAPVYPCNQSTRADFRVGQMVDSQHKQLNGISWLFLNC